jgi:hypothetical protein
VRILKIYSIILQRSYLKSNLIVIEYFDLEVHCFEKTSMIADHECAYLYVQGAKDRGDAEKAGCAVRVDGRTASA